MKKIIAISTACALLSACGGGGGGSDDSTSQSDAKLGPAVALSAANYQTATTDVLSTVMSLQSATGVAGDLLTGAQVERLPNLVIQDLPKKLNQWAQLLNTPPQLTGAVLDETLMCGYSGTIVLSVSDLNENRQLDAGDRILVTYNQCKEDRYNTVNGEMKITVNYFSIDDAYPQKTDISAAVNLVSTGPDSSLRQDGSFRILAIEHNQEKVSTTLDVPLMNTSVTQAGRTELYRTKNFVLNTDEDYSTYVLKANGDINVPTLGSNSANLKTLLPFTFNNYGQQQVARSGELLISFKDNSKVRVKATGTSSAELALDLNGDGVYEERKLVPWSDFL